VATKKKARSQTKAANANEYTTGSSAPKPAERTLERAIGAQVRLLRRSHDLSVSDLAAASSISMGMLSKIENGQISPSLSTIQAIAAALGVPITNLFTAFEERRDCSFVRANQGVVIERRGTKVGSRARRRCRRRTVSDHAAEGRRAPRLYDIRGAGAKRALPHFDDLLFLGASISRYPLEGYREKCGTNVIVGTRFARTPLALDIPITIAGMSFGSLSGPAKEALGRGATLAGTSTTTGDGGMTQEERGHSRLLVYQVLPSRYGMNPDDLRRADAIEVVVGQGAKPGGGGMLLGQKLSKRVAEMRTLPEGIDQRSASRHPDWTGPDDLEIKIDELREITDWEKPIYVKVGASRPYYDTALAVKAGADVIVVDGMQGGTAATQEVFIEHVGIPTLAAIRPAVQALQDLGLHRKVQLIVSGGIRSGADVAKALALGADAVSIGTAALVALGDNDPALEAEYNALGTTAGAYDDWHEGRDPAGITTQDPELAARLDPVAAGRRLANYLQVMTLEAQAIARACGKSHLHNLEPEDLVALTIEAAAMAGVPVAGTDWIPGQTKL
jgi:glutamate synthase domain-containing protein 2/DNA-binding XRE family transcriptional regulator